MSEKNENIEWTSKSLWYAKWYLIAKAWKLRHLCGVTSQEYESGIDFLSGLVFQKIAMEVSLVERIAP